jgi:hypothetical protein
MTKWKQLKSRRKRNSTYKSGLFVVDDVEFMGDDESKQRYVMF